MKLIIITLSIVFSFSGLAAQIEAFYLQSSHQILFTGENHKDDISRDKLTASLSFFKATGGDTLALEMIESHKQYLLDNFLDFKDNSRLELSSYLTQRWQYNTTSYMKLITRARELGIRLLAIDLDKRVWPSETALFPVPPDSSKVRAAREEHMAKVLCAATYQRVVILIGSFHAKKRFLPSKIVDECSLRSSTLTLSTL